MLHRCAPKETVMRKTIVVLLSFLVFALLAWAQQPSTASTKVVFSEETRVGGQVLPAGAYGVTHVVQDAEHIMIFTQNEKEFRANCNLVETDGSVATTYYYDDSVKGQPALLSIEFRGDNFRYAFTK